MAINKYYIIYLHIYCYIYYKYYKLLLYFLYNNFNIFQDYNSFFFFSFFFFFFFQNQEHFLTVKAQDFIQCKVVVSLFI